MLPSNIDPIPEDLARDFGLLCLHDVSYRSHMAREIYVVFYYFILHHVYCKMMCMVLGFYVFFAENTCII